MPYSLRNDPNETQKYYKNVTLVKKQQFVHYWLAA